MVRLGLSLTPSPGFWNNWVDCNKQRLEVQCDLQAGIHQYSIHLEWKWWQYHFYQWECPLTCVRKFPFSLLGSTHFQHTRTDFDHCLLHNTFSCMLYQRRRYPWDLVYLEHVNVLLFPIQACAASSFSQSLLVATQKWHMACERSIHDTHTIIQANMGFITSWTQDCCLINDMFWMYNKQFVFHDKGPNKKKIKRFFVYLRARLFFKDARSQIILSVYRHSQTYFPGRNHSQKIYSENLPGPSKVKWSAPKDLLICRAV